MKDCALKRDHVVKSTIDYNLKETIQCLSKQTRASIKRQCQNSWENEQIFIIR